MAGVSSDISDSTFLHTHDILSYILMTYYPILMISRDYDAKLVLQARHGLTVQCTLVPPYSTVQVVCHDHGKGQA